jgi:hypothetical protein
LKNSASTHDASTTYDGLKNNSFLKKIESASTVFIGKNTKNTFDRKTFEVKKPGLIFSKKKKI